MINRMKSIDSTGEYYLSITKKIVNAKAFSSLEKFLMNDAVGIVMEKVDWAIKYLIASESEENDFQLPKEQKVADFVIKKMVDIKNNVEVVIDGAYELEIIVACANYDKGEKYTEKKFSIISKRIPTLIDELIKQNNRIPNTYEVIALYKEKYEDVK